MQIKRADGKVFEINLNHIGYAMWVMELIKVDGEMVSMTYSDPYPNERECRAGAREFAKRAVYDNRYGWVIPTEIN